MFSSNIEIEVNEMLSLDHDEIDFPARSEWDGALTNIKFRGLNRREGN